MPSVHKHSRSKHFRLFVGCLCFVGIGVWQLSVEGTGSVMSWLSLVFFGGLALFYIFDLLNPKTRFIIPGSEAEKAYRATTEGPYKYFPDGFTIRMYDEYEGTTLRHCVLWQEIDEIKLHKVKAPDLLYQGLRIYYRNGGRTAVLETYQTCEGYFVLVERIKANLPGIPPDWQLDEPAEMHHETEKTLWRKVPDDRNADNA